MKTQIPSQGVEKVSWKWIPYMPLQRWIVQTIYIGGVWGMRPQKPKGFRFYKANVSIIFYYVLKLQNIFKTTPLLWFQNIFKAPILLQEKYVKASPSQR